MRASMDDEVRRLRPYGTRIFGGYFPDQAINDLATIILSLWDDRIVILKFPHKFYYPFYSIPLYLYTSIPLYPFSQPWALSPEP